MSITPRGMSVQEAYRLFRDDRLIVNRKYQRKLVWTLAEKQYLIDSLIKDYPIPLILLADASDGGSTYYEIMDGMQRLNAIFSFIDNSYPLDNKYFDIREFSRAKQAADAGAFMPVNTEDNELLSPSTCADILDYQLAVTIFPIETEDQVTDVFGRINSGGRQLSAHEKRQAGMVDEFSMLIRELASEIRGDSSMDRLPLSGMPEISIDSTRTDMGYALKAEDIFWCKQGILWTKQLRDSEDEEMVVDICASIVLDEPIARSKEYFDKIYDENNSEYEHLRREFYRYGRDRLKEEVKVTLSVLRTVIEDFSGQSNALRGVVSPGARNPIKGSFFSIFMAFHKLVVVEEKTPEDYPKIMKSLEGLQKSMIVSAKFSTTEDRVKNVDRTTGLIQRYFVKKDPPMLRHGAGLALDMENSLRRSRLETSRYECKQGLVDLSPKRKFDSSLLVRIAETICGIANVGPDADGFIFIGVADNKRDAERVSELDGIKPLVVGARYIVGLDREMQNLSINEEQYLEKIIGFIRASELSEPLRSQVLAQSDYVDYKGMSVLRIRIPAQKQISFFGEKVFVRENSSTIEATGKKLLAVNSLFT
ncbi:GmrSD restriction endonuclease domain-containing protein [Halomonas sp. 86]|uniref:GmrSD restriction endonuclease domain-containing protein n=1 Tax=unclassified Halomonas TaxID=2609666 RepID=UPI0040340013